MAWSRKTPWRQGAALTGKAFVDYFGHLDGYTCAFVASQTCDVVSEELAAEPNVVFVLAKRIDALDGSMTSGKNPRWLHVDINGTLLAIHAAEVHAVRKEVLDGTDPCLPSSIGAKELPLFRNWLAQRYRRPALPDSLNDYVGKVWENIADKLKNKTNEVMSVHIAYDPPGEHAQYDLDIMIVARVDEDGDTSVDQAHLKVAKQVAETIGKKFENWCPNGNVRLGVCAAISEREFSMFDIRTSHKLELDYLSFRTAPAGPMVG